MAICMIAAVGKNLELGKGNDLIWHFKDDMAFFKETTMGSSVIMGRKTFESLPKALPRRKNIVITTRKDYEAEGATVVNSIENALKEVDSDNAFIIGGGDIYKQFLPMADKLYLTEIEAECDDAQVFFPAFNKDEYEKELLASYYDKGIHFSNYFYSEPLLQAAKGLAKATGLDRVFMANSGTEANEGALKMARKYAIMQGHENRHEIISMNKAFHGRSMGALSVTGTAKYREPFEPMLQGVTFADYNDLESVKAAVTENTYAIIVEAVQGEGGIYPANAEFLQGIRKLCDENDIIMICDEIQCGMGRSGKMFAYQKYDIVPDIVTMAKGIGNGITVGAIAAKEEVAKCLVPGDHGTTFGGNPLACAAVAKTLEIFEKREIPNHVEEVGEYLNECLQKLVEKKEIAVETRGMGLMRGLELSVPAGPYITKALEKGVIFMSAGANVIRFIPPLIIEKSDVDKMIAILDSVLDD